LCNKRFSATQYALLSSLYAFSQNILVAPAGIIAKETGWSMFFFLSFVASFPGLALLPIFAPWNGKDPETDEGLDDLLGEESGVEIKTENSQLDEIFTDF
jgi:PAT family beta-lactamase induction signal transducer AmpG